MNSSYTIFPCHKNFLWAIERKKCKRALTVFLNRYRSQLFIGHFSSPCSYILAPLDRLSCQTLVVLCWFIKPRCYVSAHYWPDVRTKLFFFDSVRPIPLWRQNCRKLGWRPCFVMSLDWCCDGFCISTTSQIAPEILLCHGHVFPLLLCSFPRTPGGLQSQHYK